MEEHIYVVIAPVAGGLVIVIIIVIIIYKKRKQKHKKCENGTATDEAKTGPNVQTPYLKNDNTGNIPVHMNKL